MYTLTSYCNVQALFTGHIPVHMHISYVLGYVLRGGAGVVLDWRGLCRYEM